MQYILSEIKIIAVDAFYDPMTSANWNITASLAFD